MKYSTLVLAIHCSLLWLLIFGFSHVLVSAQTSPLGGLGPLLTAILPHIPTKVLGLIQISLLAKLLKQSRTRVVHIGPNGIDDDKDGLIDEEDEITASSEPKSNFMIFLGKHNIQVSNHGVKKDEIDDCDDECEGVVDYNEEEGVEEEGLNQKVNGHKNEKDFAYKYKNIYGMQEKPRVAAKNKKKAAGDAIEGEEVDPEYYPQYRPPASFLYANSNQKPTQMQPMVPMAPMTPMTPWSKKIMTPMTSSHMRSSVGTSVEVQSETNEKPKDANLLSVPNGFPLKSPQSYTLKRSSDSDGKRSSKPRGDKWRNNWRNHELSDNEINELLSHPKVIEILRKLNESLFSAEKENESKRQMNREKLRAKRQVLNEEMQSFADEEWRPIVSNRLIHTKNPMVKTFPLYPVEHSTPINDIQASSQLEESDASNTGSDASISDDEVESSDVSVQYETDATQTSNEPRDSEQYPREPEQHPRESEHHPRGPESSSSVEMAAYYPMAVTDDDTYPMQLEVGKPVDHHIGHAAPVGPMVEMGHMPYHGSHGLTQTHYVNGGHQVAYGGGDYSKEVHSKSPVMDLTYWTEVKKTKKKKKKKNKKKFYVTNEESIPEDYDEEYEDYEEEYEKPVAVKKYYTTIQVIKSGTVKGNIGYGSETRDLPEWVLRLPGLRRVMGIAGLRRIKGITGLFGNG